MQKKSIAGRKLLSYSPWLKRLLIMKMIAILILVVGLTTSYAKSDAQTAKINLKFTNGTVKDVLEEIEHQTNLSFMYDNDILKVNRQISIEAENETLKSVVEKLISGENLKYEIVNRYIVISSAKEPPANQQGKKVTGKVTDSSGGSLPGVSIVIKGTSTGVITDSNGNFTISNVPENATLIFSFVGMKTQEVKGGKQSTINVVLVEEAIGIEEVVVIGYGSRQKKDLTGAISSIKLKDVNQNANSSVMQALQGSLPGLSIGAVTSAGGDPSIQIRGVNTLSGGSSPLIVVDGVIFSSDISDLNPSDIERVDVLKDASSAAVYGSRSANGVIQITTKKGTSEKPVFNFNVYQGFQQMSHKIDMMNGEQYVQKLLDWREATGQSHNPTSIDTYLQTLEVDNYHNKHFTDWIDLLTRNGNISEYDLSVSGKTKKTNYFISGSYADQKGVVLGDQFKRTTLRANFSNDITDWLTIGTNFTFSNKDYSGVSSSLGIGTISGSPLATFRDTNNNLIMYPFNDQIISNPLIDLSDRNSEIQDNLFAILFADIKIPHVKGLKLHIDYSDNLQFYKNNTFYNSDTFTGLYAPNGQANKYIQNRQNWSMNNILSYSQKFGKHSVDATLLYSREGFSQENTGIVAKNFSTQVLGYNALQLGMVQTANSDALSSAGEAFMSRLAYTYNLKYLLTATFRRDGYSGFAAGNKYANFPSLSLGWVLSEEEFAKSMHWLNHLKLRASYGVNGNQALGSYGSLSRMSSLNYVFGSTGSPSIGIYPSSMSNSNLTWEKTTSKNLGLDFIILDNRISGSMDVYEGKTSSLLVQRSLPVTTSFQNVWANIGELKNKGVELNLSTVNIKTENFKWETRLNFSLNRNQIVHLYGPDSDVKEPDDIGNRWFIGKSIGANYDYTLNGIYKTDEANIPAGFRPGDYRLKDINNDKIISPDDRSVIGYNTPNYRFGIYNDLKYKGFSFSCMINSVQGGGKDHWYTQDNSIGLLPNTWFNGQAGRVNLPNYNYWTPNNQINSSPRIDYSPAYSHGVYQDRSFIRLQDVTFSYSLPTSIVSKYRLGALKFYVSGKNLYTWTKWTGWDPESGGTLYGGMPVMRSYVGGFNINF